MKYKFKGSICDENDEPINYFNFIATIPPNDIQTAFEAIARDFSEAVNKKICKK